MITRLAYADVMQLKPIHIITGIDGEKWVATFRQKTNVRTSVTLLIERGKEESFFLLLLSQHIYPLAHEL